MQKNTDKKVSNFYKLILFINDLIPNFTKNPKDQSDNSNE